MNQDSIEIIDDAVVEAVRALFGAHGVTFTFTPPSTEDAGEPSTEDEIAATVGFTSAHMRGAVVTTTRKAVIAAAWPRELRADEPFERDITDWAAELTNQLVGRVKNQLAAFGLTLLQSTPTVITGHHLHRAPASTTLTRRYRFRSAVGEFTVCFDAVTAEDFELDRAARGQAVAAREGELELF